MVRVSPTRRYRDVPSTPEAFFEAVTVSLSSAFSRAKMAVMTLVVEAMGSF